LAAWWEFVVEIVETQSSFINAKMASSVAIATFLMFSVLVFQNVIFNNHGMVSEAKLMTERSASAAFTLKVLYW
jgi:hypothetical protein